MMCELLSLETPKKGRSVRFNDNALETIVSYDTDDMDVCQFNDSGPEAFPIDFEVAHNDDAMRLYRRSGSHESLYDKMSIETASMNPRMMKKRSSDLDDSNHFSSSSHSYRNATFDMDTITSNGFNSNNSSHHRSFVSRSGLSIPSRGSDDNDLDVSRHNRQQRHFNKRVMCV
jgi:hypothetical protein